MSKDLAHTLLQRTRALLRSVEIQNQPIPDLGDAVIKYREHDAKLPVFQFPRAIWVLLNNLRRWASENECEKLKIFGDIWSPDGIPMLLTGALQCLPSIPILYSQHLRAYEGKAKLIEHDSFDEEYEVIWERFPTKGEMVVHFRDCVKKQKLRSLYEEWSWTSDLRQAPVAVTLLWHLFSSSYIIIGVGQASMDSRAWLDIHFMPLVHLPLARFDAPMHSSVNEQSAAEINEIMTSRYRTHQRFIGCALPLVAETVRHLITSYLLPQCLPDFIPLSTGASATSSAN